MSLEVDVLPIDDDEEEIRRLADMIEGVAGELSLFDETHGFHIDGVDLGTAILPEGWRQRLVKIQSANTAPASGQPRFIGWCLDKEDLCVAKLCAYRQKDLNFVAALLDHRLVDHQVIAARLDLVPGTDARVAGRAREWLRGAMTGTSTGGSPA